MRPFVYLYDFVNRTFGFLKQLTNCELQPISGFRRSYKCLDAQLLLFGLGTQIDAVQSQIQNWWLLIQNYTPTLDATLYHRPGVSPVTMNHFRTKSLPQLFRSLGGFTAGQV